MTDLLERLTQANIVCRDCGTKYGKYSVGCSSVWEGTCGVCGEKKPVTEVRDYGYLTKGITALQRGESLEEDDDPCAYEQGELTLKLTEEEVGFLNECLDVIVDNHESLCAGHSNERPEDIKLFESIEKKITELYNDYCVKYELSPALKAYNAKYGTWGMENEVEVARWEGFRDAFVAAHQ